MPVGTVLKSKTVKTRKPHRCEGCLKEFPPGTEMTVATVVPDDGGIVSEYWCSHCERHSRDYDHSDWDSFRPGDVGFWEGDRWFPVE